MRFQAGLLLNLLRVRQWPKNILVYAALIFTSNLFNTAYLLKVTIGFFLFSFAASSLYILNDILDYKQDRIHPEKKNRPIASGEINRDFALVLSAILMTVSLTGSYFLNFEFFITVASYIIITTLYSLRLKHVVILDIFAVSSGFVLRAISGAFIISVSISPWLIICVSLGALFMSLGKRRYELSLPDAAKHRRILDEYSIPLVDEMISMVTASTVISYSLYTFLSETASKHNYMMLTIPFVLYGIFRYLYLMHKKNLGGSPEMILLKDVPMIICVTLYLLTTIAIVYFLK
ncbi:MAG: decaprenyl-phosphate phosphoribosyltransferase [Spirochaetia bacterium]|nr:decaprenyl-phosphate phosphoribosyltransferase [Spirochaetia bacterium]